MHHPVPSRGLPSRRNFLLLLAGAATALPAATLAADNPYDPEKPGKQHSIVKGKNVQPTEPHVRRRLKRKQEEGKVRKDAATPQKPD